MPLIAKQRFAETKVKVSYWTTGISSFAAFLLMFQIYMIAPLLTVVSRDLNSNGVMKDLLIPSITISMGLSSLLSRKLSEYFGMRNFIMMSVASLALSANLVLISESIWSLIAVRWVSGFLLGGILPLSFRLASENYPPEKRFTPVMIIVFGMAGGMTFGPVFGALLLDSISWRTEFALVGELSLGLFFLVGYLSSYIPVSYKNESLRESGRNNKKRWTYKGNAAVILLFVLINGILHSGLFVWSIETITTRFKLGNSSSGMVLLDFGLPGLLVVVTLGFLTKSISRMKMEIVGLCLLSLCIIMMIYQVPLLATLLTVALLSVGYNITQPLFFGIIGELSDGKDGWTAVQTGSCFLFIGYGLGPVIFSFLLTCGHSSAVLFLVFLLAVITILSRIVFKNEQQF